MTHLSTTSLHCIKRSISILAHHYIFASHPSVEIPVMPNTCTVFRGMVGSQNKLIKQLCKMLTKYKKTKGKRTGTSKFFNNMKIRCFHIIFLAWLLKSDRANSGIDLNETMLIRRLNSELQCKWT